MSSSAHSSQTFVPAIATPYHPDMVNSMREPDDALHEPDPPGFKYRSGPSVRGCGNVLTLAIIVGLIVGLFMGYPLTDWIMNGGIRQLMSNNVYVNGTGQAPILCA